MRRGLGTDRQTARDPGTGSRAGGRWVAELSGLAACFNQGKPWEARPAADVWAEHKVRVSTAAAALPPPASPAE